jgi:hypothetical protein
VLPVVDHVHDRVERLAAERARHGARVAAVRLEVANARPEVVTVAPVKHRDVVPPRREALHDFATHELEPANDQNAHSRMIHSHRVVPACGLIADAPCGIFTPPRGRVDRRRSMFGERRARSGGSCHRF